MVVIDQWAVVACVIDSVVVIVVVADIAFVVRVSVELVGVRVEGTIIHVVRDGVVVIVVIADIAHAVAVEVVLGRVLIVGAVIDGVTYTVFVSIGQVIGVAISTGQRARLAARIGDGDVDVAHHPRGSQRVEA